MKKYAAIVSALLAAVVLASSCLAGSVAPTSSPAPDQSSAPRARKDPTVDPAAEFAKAEQAFEKGVFQEAYSAYERAYRNTDDNVIRQKSFFRMCESLTHLFRYGEAAQLLFDTPLPPDKAERARALLFKAGLARTFVRQYASILRRNESTAGETGVFRLTREEVEKEIDTSYQALWDLRDVLKSLPLKEEGYFFLTEGVEFSRYPTLFDFFILKWTDDILAGAQAAEREIEAVLSERFSPPPAPGKLSEAAHIMEEASVFMADTQAESAAYWRYERAAAAFRVGWPVLPQKKSDALRERAVALLTGWMGSFTTAGPRAQAGLKAAEIQNTRGRYQAARILCDRVLEQFPDAPAAKNAQALRRQITNPVLYLSVERMTLREQKTITLTVRNLNQVYLRAWQLSPALLRRLEANPQQLYQLSQGYDDRGPQKEILAAKSDFSWTFETGDKGDHEFLSLTTAPPVLKEGVYFIVACSDQSFTAGQTLWTSSLVPVSSLMLVSTPGLTLKSRTGYYGLLGGRGAAAATDSLFRYYTLDAETGRPVPRSDLFVGWSRDYGTPRQKRLATDLSGGAALALPVSLSPQDYDYYYAYPLARKGSAYAYLQYQQYFSKYLPQAYDVFIETDRPIYRPGDKLMAKITGVRRTPDGYKALAGTRSVSIRAFDPNGKTFFEKSVTLNEFGSADVEFEIPRGKLLGTYSINARTGQGHLIGQGSTGFQVEEYKRPEFEITFDTPEQLLRFGTQAEVTGKVKYYFGGAAANADVEYTITKSFYLPWYFRSWYYGGYAEQNTEKASGKIKTDETGAFRLSFTPETADAARPAWLRHGLAPAIARYTVTVLARDEGGRTIEGTFTCKASANGFYFTIQPDKNFFFEKETARFALDKLSVNDRPLAGEADYEIFLLKNPPLRTWRELGYGSDRSGQLSGNFPGPEFQLKDAENLRSVLRGQARFGTDGKSTLSLVSPAPGAYRIVLSAPDGPAGKVVQEKIFLVVNNQGKDIPVNLTSVAVFEKDEYRVGDKARLLLGSRFTAGTYMAEVWAGGFFSKNLLLSDDKPLQVLEITVTPEMKGGFSIRWFGAFTNDLWYGQAAADVPWSDKRLRLALNPFQETLLPGQKAAWGVKTLDAAGRPVRSEVLMLMYDRSLEYYRRSSSRSFASLYLPNPGPQTAAGSDFRPNVHYAPLRDGVLYRQLYVETRYTAIPSPGFRTDRTGVTYYKGRDGNAPRGAVNLESDLDMMSGDEPPESQPAPAPALADTTVSRTDKADRLRQETSSADDRESAQAPPDVQARQAFADTAFFLPHVVTDKKGVGYFSFTTPEQLTGWKVKALALTPDAAWGEIEAEAVTRKDLMVRLDLPRFFREKDQGTVTLIVHNESDKPLSGTAWIDVRQNDQSILAAVQLTGPSQSFTVKAHGLKSFEWPVTIPAGIGAYTVRATAKAGDLTDAEERLLPILPSRQRLIESAFTVMKGSITKTVSLPAGADPTRINESVTLEIDPQLALSLLNTIPFLIDYPYSCVEQSLNKYVPLAVINEIYGQYPEVKAAVAKIPRRDTVTPPWEKKDPRRQLEIEETPWGWEAAGRPSMYPVIDLLDPAIVAAQKEAVLSDIRASQLSSGAFPWWPGGRADLYMTLYVLAGMLEAERHGVAVDKNLVNHALGYVNTVVPQSFQPEPYQLAIIAYAAYVVSGFNPQEYSQAARGRELVGGWLDFLYKNRFALTPFGKGYLAHVYFRLGDQKKGDEILAMALDGAREDEVAGVYWTPEAYSWVWYSDTVEKHAFFLKTLLEFRPDDRRIDGMARWLLFNRTGNVWKSTKASAAALYALFDYMEKGGSLLADETFTVDWGDKKEMLTAKGAEWNPQPLRLIRTDQAAGAAGLKALITKEGPGTSFASLTWIYSTDQLPEASGPGLLTLDRRFYLRVKQGGTYRLREIRSGDTVSVGDQVEVQVKVATKSQFEYMHLKDPKAAGFEAETLLSGWKYDPLWFYEEPKDSTTNFFFGWIPHGEYVLRYRLRPTKAGEYRIGAATLQSMYAPELNAHSAGFVIKVRK